MLKTRARRGGGPSKDALLACRDTVFVVAGLRVDLAALGEAEQFELVALSKRLAKGAEAVQPLTDKERRRWESLVGEAAGIPDIFDRRRQEEVMASKFEELKRRALRRPA